jgi:hypothetical protein
MKTIAVIVALLFAPAAGAAFKCVDENGRTFIGETPPEGCARVMMYEISRSGTIIRRIEPTPTPEQRKVREAEELQRRELEKREAERKRHDKALIATFASEKEFDVARERNIEPLMGRIRSAQERVKEIDKRLAQIDEEGENYKAGARKGAAAREVPRNLVDERERLLKEKHSLAAGVTASEKDIQAQRERFDRDKKRWVELRSGVDSQPVADRK